MINSDFILLYDCCSMAEKSFSFIKNNHIGSVQQGKVDDGISSYNKQLKYVLNYKSRLLLLFTEVMLY